MRAISQQAVAAAVAAVCELGSAHADQGLNGVWYDLGASVPNVAAALAAAGTPAFTFRATTPCFPTCGNVIGDGVSPAAFFGGNATDFSSDPTLGNAETHLLTLTGFLNVTTTGNYSFRLGSDDGSQLFIDGALVADNDGDHGFNVVDTGPLALATGAHAIRVLQFENGGVTGLTLLRDGVALGAELSTTAVPEPATAALLLAGLAAAALRRLQRAPALQHC